MRSFSGYFTALLIFSTQKGQEALGSASVGIWEHLGGGGVAESLRVRDSASRSRMHSATLMWVVDQQASQLSSGR